MSVLYFACSRFSYPLCPGHTFKEPGRVAQTVTCLATDASLTADPGSLVRSRPSPILSLILIMK